MRLAVRFSEEEYRNIAQNADVAGLSLAAYVRTRCRGGNVVAKTDLRILAELRRIGGLLKHIHNESNGAYSVQTADLLRQLSSYIRKLSRERETKEPRKQA